MLNMEHRASRGSNTKHFFFFSSADTQSLHHIGPTLARCWNPTLCGNAESEGDAELFAKLVVCF